MSKAPILFRYSGSKRKIVPLLRPLPFHKRIVEGYLGSGCFSLMHSGPAIGYDVNKDIIDIWHFLQGTTPEYLIELEKIRREACSSHPKNKPDARDLKLPKPVESYVRVNTSGVYAGQLSSWVLYPQHRIPVVDTTSLLSRAREVEVYHGRVEDLYKEEDGDIVFLDPPYKFTKSNYKQQGKKGIEEAYDPQQTIDLISKIQSPVILTYGTNAKETFPNYQWEEVLKRKVPNIRCGGTVDRTEHVAYVNWN